MLISISESDLGSTFLPCFLFTASVNICVYKSYPTESIKPCCCRPNKFPAPRIDKSRMAILNPDPNSVKSLIASNRFSLTSVNTLLGLYMK